MSRKEERAQLDALIESVGTFGQLNHREKNQLITKLLDGGFRYNPTVLRIDLDDHPGQGDNLGPGAGDGRQLADQVSPECGRAKRRDRDSASGRADAHSETTAATARQRPVR